MRHIQNASSIKPRPRRGHGLEQMQIDPDQLKMWSRWPRHVVGLRSPKEQIPFVERPKSTRAKPPNKLKMHIASN